MNDPTPRTAPAPDTSSLAAGIGIAWAILVGGYIVLTILVGVVANMSQGSYGFAGIATILGVVPLVLYIYLLIASFTKGRRRFGLGLAIGLASIAAVCLLLIAACFGLLSTMH